MAIGTVFYHIRLALLFPLWRDSKARFASDKCWLIYRHQNRMIFPWLIFCVSVSEPDSRKGCSWGPTSSSPFTMLAWATPRPGSPRNPVSQPSSRKPPRSLSLTDDAKLPNIHSRSLTAGQRSFSHRKEQVQVTFSGYVQETSPKDWLKNLQMSKE